MVKSFAKVLMTILKPDFFARDTLKVARELIGKFIVTKNKKLLINEVEAYTGPHDLACHAARGRTPRTEILYGRPGLLYVYFVYGIHWMLNVVTERNGFPAAVLIRGTDEIKGPARLTKFLKIDKRYNGRLASPETGLWFEDGGVKVESKNIKKTSRIGVDYAGPVWSKKPYRFFCNGFFCNT